MTDVSCPQCHAPALSAAKKPYCSVCGWNIDIAEHTLLRELRNFPLGLILLATPFAVVFVISERRTIGIWIVFSALASALFGTTVVRDWTALRRLRHARSFLNKPFGTVPAPVGISWDERTLREHDYILSLPKPRNVRISRAGRTTVLIFSVLCVTFLVVATLLILSHLPSSRMRTGKDFSDLIGAAIAFFFSGLVFLGLWRDFRARRLLENGEVTLGRVKSQQWTGKRQSQSKITYRYQDRSGKLYVGSGPDHGRTLFEAMPAPVFYDPDNPNKHVAACSGLWEVVSSTKQKS